MVKIRQYDNIKSNPNAAYTCLLILKGYSHQDIINKFRANSEKDWELCKGSVSRRIRAGMELYRIYGNEIKQETSHMTNEIEIFDFICNFMQNNNISQRALLNYPSFKKEEKPTQKEDFFYKIKCLMEDGDISIDELAKYIQEENNG